MKSAKNRKLVATVLTTGLLAVVLTSCGGASIEAEAKLVEYKECLASSTALTRDMYQKWNVGNSYYDEETLQNMTSAIFQRAIKACDYYKPTES